MMNGGSYPHKNLNTNYTRNTLGATIMHMEADIDKVVKCNGCALHFMYTQKAKKCPFCHTPYVGGVAEKVEEKPKEKKVAVKSQNQKESFKMWKDS